MLFIEKTHKQRGDILPKESNQKLKLLYLLKILYEQSDEEHFLPMSYLIEKLASYGVSAERKSIYSDLEYLEQFGFDIIKEKGKNAGYALLSREFELAHLKHLVDSVQASKFITEKKADELIKKLEGLTSKHNAKKLRRNVYISQSVKSINETIYYNIDTLHEAINNKKKVAFKYFEYNLNKERVLKNNGDDYIASPYSLTICDENYYLVSHYEKHENFSNFRVDKMEKIRILDEDIVDYKTFTDPSFEIADYSKKLFSMFSGEIKDVKILCENSLVNAVIDRFGRDVLIRKETDTHFVATLKVSQSPTFFAWVFTFGDKMKIISPSDTAKEFKNTINKVKGIY